MSEQSSSTAAPASATPASASASLGTQIDAEIVLLKSRVAKLESTAKADWTALKARVSKDWPHFVTWVGLAASSAPVLDIVKKLI